MKGEAGHMLHNENPNQEGHIWGSTWKTAFILGSSHLLLTVHWNCVMGVTQVPLLVYWTFSGLLVVDVTGKPNFTSRYRIQVDNKGQLWGHPCRGELPTFHWFLLELVVFTLIEEVLFCHSHHHKKHKWTVPIAATVYLSTLLNMWVDQCYAALGMLDYLHGTDIMFKQTKAYKRHIILLGFTPLSESIPDPLKMID